MKLVAFMVLFAVLDLAFAGFRAAAGRGARLRQGGRAAVAVVVGAVVGLLVAALLGGGTWIVLGRASDASFIYENLLVAGARMWFVFAVYVVIVLAALAVYAVSRHETRTLASTLVLGPFTLARPYVIALASVWGALASESLAASIVALASGGAVIATAALLDRFYPSEVPKLLAVVRAEARGGRAGTQQEQ